MKKLLSIALILSIALAAAGCAGSPKQTGTTEAGSSTVQEIQAPETETASETEPVTETETETEAETETETETETESETEPPSEPETSDTMDEELVQLQLELRYGAAVGRVSLDEELFGTALGDFGKSLAEKEGELTEYQQLILDACAWTPAAGPHYCAGWISSVCDNAGIYGIGGNANDMWEYVCYSSDPAELEPGMLIAVQHSRTDQDSDGYIYGHVGIYIGGGYVIQSTTVEGEGRKVITSIDDWLVRYDPYGTVKWGFPQ